MSEPLVCIADLYKEFRRGPEVVKVLDGLSLGIEAGDFVALMGPSGSGKSTLLNLIGGLDRPSTGSVTIGEECIDQMSSRELSAWRARHVGFVFQMYNLLPALTAERNVELPLLLTPLGRLRRRQQVATALALVGLTDRARHYPRQLSGGQEQRVGIARALAQEPSVLLADEPVASLDPVLAHSILQYLELLNRQDGITVLCSLHFLDLVHRYASRVIGLKDGELVFDGLPSELTRERFKEVYGEEAEMVTVGGGQVE